MSSRVAAEKGAAEQAPALTKPQKAAAILVAMGKPSASKLLKFFKQEELKALIEAARMLSTIPQNQLEAIVAEFEAEFTEGVGLLDSGDTMDTLLSEALSPEEVNALMASPESKQEETAKDQPVWPQVAKLPPERLSEFLNREHPQTAALILSNLPSQAAAEALLKLDKELRTDVIRRMMGITAIPEAAVHIAETQIRARLLADNAPKDNAAGQQRVANVLNELDKSRLDEVMQDLESSGAAGLDAVRARLFSFEDIGMLDQKARVKLFDGLSTELVTLALRNATATLAEAVLSSVSARSRRMIESELGMQADGIAAVDILRARRTIASTAIRLAGEGALQLPSTRQDEAA
ncbi:MAG: flagellar motor switch protein FliG [Rhizobiales bacterium]|nr:flagellar motor switch protein FliG [Hyphomicrobiales bacterium]